MTRPDYWRTDTEDDAVSSVAAAADFLARARSNPSYWKWAVLALHSAAQGFLALSLRQGNNFLVQKPGRTKAILAAFDAGTAVPEPYMDNFMGLYRKAKDPGNFSSRNTPVPDNAELEEAVEAFDQMRDELTHFNPRGWSIALACIQSRCFSIVTVIESVLESRVILWHTDGLDELAASELKKARVALLE